MSSPKVSIQIVSWNSLKFLPDCLTSIFQQTNQNFSVLIIDNNSNDGTIKYLEQNWPQVKVLKNSKNLGFARAHNQGILTTQSDYILILNPDIILDLSFLDELLKIADNFPKVASLSGKLLRVRSGDTEIAEKIKTDMIDSAGLEIFKSRRIIDRGENETDNHQYDQQEEVFGFSGACVLYRRKALETAKINLDGQRAEYFDEDFFAYKEDVDLAWRLQLKNWQAIYVPQARAYHFRAISLNQRFSKSSWANFYSFRNHLWLIIKNDQWSNLWRDSWRMVGYQLSKAIFLLFTQPKVLWQAKLSFWQKILPMLKKRKYILSVAKKKPLAIRKWLS